jgi:hypothetical protein
MLFSMDSFDENYPPPSLSIYVYHIYNVCRKSFSRQGKALSPYDTRWPPRLPSAHFSIKMHFLHSSNLIFVNVFMHCHHVNCHYWIWAWQFNCLVSQLLLIFKQTKCISCILTLSIIVFLTYQLSLLVVTVPFFGNSTFKFVPSSSALIPMSICTLQCLLSHSFTTYEWLNRYCDRNYEQMNWVLVSQLQSQKFLIPKSQDSIDSTLQPCVWELCLKFNIFTLYK